MGGGEKYGPGTQPAAGRAVLLGWSAELTLPGRQVHTSAAAAGVYLLSGEPGSARPAPINSL